MGIAIGHWHCQRCGATGMLTTPSTLTANNGSTADLRVGVWYPCSFACLKCHGCAVQAKFDALSPVDKTEHHEENVLMADLPKCYAVAKAFGEVTPIKCDLCDAPTAPPTPPREPCQPGAVGRGHANIGGFAWDVEMGTRPYNRWTTAGPRGPFYKNNGA